MINLRTLSFTALLTAISFGLSAQDQPEGESSRYMGHKQIIGPEIQVEDVRKFAEEGDVLAQHLMGTLSELGKAPQYAEAARWYRLAAEKGEVESQVSLAELFMNGHEDIVGSVEAVKWLRRAADAKHPRAYAMLGWISVADSKKEDRLIVAEDYFFKAIEVATEVKDLVLAYIGMAAVNEKSQPVEAAKWTRQAAELGSSRAQFVLAEHYRTGRGVPQNVERAYFWYALAAAYGEESSEAARRRDAIAESLSPERLASMQSLAAEWKPAISASEARSRLTGR